jgi:hypothetical protein
MGVGVVPELLDQGVAVEGFLHDKPLNAASSSVNDAHLSNTGGECGRYILVDD